MNTKLGTLKMLALTLLVALAGAGVCLRLSAAETAVAVPAPALDNPKSAGPLQTAVLAGGCFWGMQGVFEHVKGVREVLAGYAGGDRANASYAMVSEGTTGHAESVQIRFDPQQVSYGDILRIYFSVAHDPTQRNRQGPDIGSQYRSEIFYADPAQQRIARAYIAQLDAARVFDAGIATRVVPLQGFYVAEGYHQDFLVNHPHNPYIVINDLPKIENLRRLFPAAWSAQPALVGDRQKRS